MSWADFSIVDIAPLSAEATEKIIEKMQLEEAIKSRFIAEMRKNLRHTHSEFLSNPLLLNVMIMTFNDLGNISSNRHQFLEDAFNTLWARHDARKEGFVRQHFSDLSKQQFIQIVSALAISTYIEELFDIREDDFDKHLQNSMNMVSVDNNLEEIKSDLHISTSLIIRDGDIFRFSHRYFQEYFSAMFVSSLPDEDVADAIEVLSKRYQTDKVLHLLRSIDDDKFERLWILNKYKGFKKVFNFEKDTFEKYEKLFIEKRFNKDKNYVDFFEFLEILRSIYEMSPIFVEMEAYLGFRSGSDDNMLEKIDFDENDEVLLNPIKLDYENQKNLCLSLGKKFEDRLNIRKKLFGMKLNAKN